jgi:hypothetical protein
LHYSFEATALVHPVREWHLMRGQDDSYYSQMNDFQTNVLSHLKNYKFERGDISEVNFVEGLNSGVFLKANDTVGYIHSYFIDNEIAKLQNLKMIEEEALIMYTAGEKQELIDQAQQRYDYAVSEKEIAYKKFLRQKALYYDSVISIDEFETYEGIYKLAEINVDISYNELQSIKTGAKKEEINYVQQKIDSYQREIELLESLRDQYYIISPIDGLVSYSNVLEGIMTVSDTSKYILKIPVKVNNIQYLNKLTAIKFSVPGYEDKMDAAFIDLDENVNLLPNQQMVIAKAVIDRGKLKLYPGLAVQCKVICDEITLWQYLKRGIELRL